MVSVRLILFIILIYILFQLRIMDNSEGSSAKSEEEEEVDSRPIKHKKEKTNSNKNKAKIVINISDCQYPVVSKVAKHFGWKMQSTTETFEWDVCWTDNAVQPETLTKMELHQKINHFPGMYNLARKNLLGRALMRMRKQFPKQYDFFPLTWMLPVEYHELKAYYQSKAKGKARTFIVKPQCLSQGKGIFLTRKLEDINPTSHCVVQRYLHKPYLIEGLKFDLRIYVLIASVDPLVIYLYEQGLGRFATEKYEAPNKDNMEEVCMHLTNYAINKDNPKFVFNQSEKDMSKGHKRSLTSVYELLQSHGVDIVALKTKIKDCIVKTMISGLPHLTNTYKSCQPESYAANMCFQLLGFDVMLNDKAEPIILEINHTPSFTTDTPLDQFIKFNYIKDALTIMNINEKTKNQVIKIQKQICQQRVMTGKKVKLTPEERQIKKRDIIAKKLKFQLKNKGKFQRIYPTFDENDPYKAFIEYADEVFQISMGSRRKTKNIEKTEEIKAPSIGRSKNKKPAFSTTPELVNRKLLGERKYQSKRSILSQSQTRNNKSNTYISTTGNIQNRESVSTQPFPFENIEKRQDQIFAVTRSIKPESQKSVISKTHQQQFKQMLNNYTKEQKELKTQEQDIFGDKEFNQMKNVRARQSTISEKRINKKPIFVPKNTNLREKIPISLNTLLINGLEQHNNFIVNNLKKIVSRNKE